MLVKQSFRCAPPDRLPWDAHTTLLLGGSLVLLVTLAPFLSAGSDDSAFWDFNRASWVAAAFGLLVAVILAIGLSAAYGAVDALLGVEVPDELYFDTSVICFGVVLPWQALSAVPRRFDPPGADYCPKWAGVQIQIL